MVKKKKKICPLTYAVSKGAYDQEISDWDYCVKEACAWWFASEGRCSRLVSTEFLGFIVKYLSDISNYLGLIEKRPSR